MRSFVITAGVVRWWHGIVRCFQLQAHGFFYTDHLVA